MNLKIQSAPRQRGRMTHRIIACIILIYKYSLNNFLLKHEVLVSRYFFGVVVAGERCSLLKGECTSVIRIKFIELLLEKTDRLNIGFASSKKVQDNEIAQVNELVA
mmetsp:Transcript_543/g.952  ORF Transcript_543/g.952 Transcript_543/m.952 type:complete len:106 (+) Transcript_543:72-389(+)